MDGMEQYPNAILRVYNRWGNLVFEKFGGYDDSFDGTNGGSDLPIGTYYWTVDFNERGVEPESGVVTIIR